MINQIHSLICKPLRLLFWTILCSGSIAFTATILDTAIPIRSPSTPLIRVPGATADLEIPTLFPQHHRYRSIRRVRFGDSNTFSLNTTDTGASGESGFGDSNTFSLNTTDTGASGESGFGDSTLFHSTPPILEHPGNQFGIPTLFLNTTDTGASGNQDFRDSNTFSLNTTDTGASGESGFGDSNTFSLNTTDTGASGESGFGDSNTFSLNH